MKKERVDWHKYAVHDDSQIAGFFGEFRFLSNFHKCSVSFDNVMYPSSENAYQAAKIIVEERQQFTRCSPAESKALWWKCTKLYSSKEWDEKRIDVMSAIVFDKFSRNMLERYSLMATGDKLLVEKNDWNDTFWGVNLDNVGENNLGKILMRIRHFWLATTCGDCYDRHDGRNYQFDEETFQMQA